jgi:putative transposase
VSNYPAEVVRACASSGSSAIKDCGQPVRACLRWRGNPYDNTFAESFIKTLKYEEVHLNDYETFAGAHESIEQFLEDVYNHKRLHSAIGYRPPAEFEQVLSTPTPP